MDIESSIGFSSIRNILREKCISAAGRQQLDEMAFSADHNVVRNRLGAVAEMVAAISSGKDLPLEGMHDVAEWLVAIRADGSYLQPGQLHRLKQFLNGTEKIKAFFRGTSDAPSPYPILNKCFDEILVFPALLSVLDSVLNKFGEIKDTASPELAEIRRSMASASASVSSIMRRVISRAAADGIIDSDVSPAMRDGRLVIPVEASRKRAISGIVQDESATGRTVFIEPSEVVEASNRLKELEMRERREIIAILTRVAAEIRPHIDDILATSVLMGKFDFIRAKALFAIETGGEMPVVEKNPGFDWYHAVHPILLLSLKAQGREVVPLNLQLDKDKRILIISGPNAGGKSVALKTVGIVQYMAQCGLLPTLYSNSHLGIFRRILIDIGDDQSIENDLSTYSSHLRNMKYFLAKADSRTLVLADEMGSGTEPSIGGALAQAIITSLNRDNKCYAIITTHYHNLKTFADSEPGIINGAMLYDRQNLRPLFQLETGSAGSSFAIEIARNIGLPKAIIDNARELVGSDYVDMEKYLLDIARDKRYWANKRLAIKEKEQKIERLLESYESRADELRAKRGEILGEAREEARKILSDANARIENTIHEIRKADAEKERTKEVRKDLEEYRRMIESEEKADGKTPDLLKTPKPRKKKERPGKNAPAKTVATTELKVGDYVKMEGSSVTGSIISISGKEAEVAFGALRTRVAVKKLQPAKRPKETAATQSLSVSKSTSDDSRRRQLNFKGEIDVRGMRADEAIQAVTYFIDDAVQFSADRVRILHGTGTGALKVAIRQYLDSLGFVKSFQDEDVRFGGAGITVVTL